MAMKRKTYSTLEYMLMALVPYTKPNLLLAYKPNAFFNELERISKAKRTTLQSTLARAQRQGLVVRHKGVPKLTRRGQRRIQPYTAQTLNRGVCLMVIFDIPEEQAGRRRQLRNALRQLSFRQEQKSVWTSRIDHRKELRDILAQLDIKPYVQVFECATVPL
jgi:DNA-binding transcriptional regulator PaaX